VLGTNAADHSAASWRRYQGFPLGLSGLYIRTYFTADIGIIDAENERLYKKHKITQTLQLSNYRVEIICS
jgi:hypothetical protein